MSIQDPFREREAEKYENPIPSREAILALIEKQSTPVGRDELMILLKLKGEEQEEALRRRLRAMERDGQLIFTRSRAYALPDKMNLIKGTVMGHKDGFGFLRPEEGGEDLFLAPREMDRLMHGDYVLVQPTGLDPRGRREARFVRLLKSRELEIVGRFFVENDVSFVVPDDARIGQDILIPPGQSKGARQSQMVVARITQRPSGRMNAVGEVVEVLAEVEVGVGLPAGGAEGGVDDAVGEARPREEALAHARGEGFEGERRREADDGGDGHRVVAAVHVEARDVVAGESLPGGHAAEDTHARDPEATASGPRAPAAR